MLTFNDALERAKTLYRGKIKAQEYDSRIQRKDLERLMYDKVNSWFSYWGVEPVSGELEFYYPTATEGVCDVKSFISYKGFPFKLVFNFSWFEIDKIPNLDVVSLHNKSNHLLAGVRINTFEDIYLALENAHKFNVSFV